MTMDYETARAMAGTWGLIAFILMFAVVLVYALWPRNRGKFRDASKIPLGDD
jgi:cytochrome c oxidase cbb3-type subunit 4